MYKKIDSDMFDKEARQVRRGGSWGDTAGSARAANRGGTNPGNRYSLLGFRLCRETS